jgi:hypothetical protein
MDEPGSSAPPESTSHSSPASDDRDRSESLGIEESGMRGMSSEVENMEESEIEIIFGGTGETEDDEDDEEGNDNDDDDDDEIGEDDLGYGRLHYIAAGPVGATCGNIC